MSTGDEGASLGEQLLDASRRNNDDLLESIFEKLGGDAAKISSLVNGSRDPLGNTALHLCCRHGSWEVLDRILDVEGAIEIDPVNQPEGDTPLHEAVRYAAEEPEHGSFIVANLVEVGADPRIRNRHGQKPIDLIHSAELDDLYDTLQGAELAVDSAATHQQPEEVIDDDEDDDEADEDM